MNVGNGAKGRPGISETLPRKRTGYANTEVVNGEKRNSGVSLGGKRTGHEKFTFAIALLGGRRDCIQDRLRDELVSGWA